MIVINDVQVLLVPMEWTVGPSLNTYLGYMSDGTDSVVWSSYSCEYCSTWQLNLEQTRKIFIDNHQ